MTAPTPKTRVGMHDYPCRGHQYVEVQAEVLCDHGWDRLGRDIDVHPPKLVERLAGVTIEDKLDRAVKRVRAGIPGAVKECLAVRGAMEKVVGKGNEVSHP